MRSVPVRPSRQRFRPQPSYGETGPLGEAARLTLRAIEQDRRRAPESLRPLFESIRRHLFDLHLDLKQIQEDAGVDASAWTTFRVVVGESPWAYLKNARLEAAARALLITSLKVPQIAKLVGYASVSAFRKAFADFAGMSPAVYRRRARAALKLGGVPPDGSNTQGYWERMLSGDLNSADAGDLDQHLAGLFPSGGAPRESVAGLGVPGDSEAFVWIKLRAEMAMGLAEALEALDWADQRLLVRDAAWFPDASFFNALSLCGDRIGQEDPERGVQLALLAVDSLASNGLLGVDPGLAVLAWTRLARSRWRARDLPGADDALDQVQRDLARVPEGALDPAIDAERCRTTSALRWHQGRREEALQLADDAVTLERSAPLGFLARTLLLRAEIHASVNPQAAPRRRRESLHAALADLEEVRGLADAAWTWEGPAAFELWLDALVRLDNRSEMERALPAARRLAEESEDKGMTARLRWFEGHLSLDAGRLWGEARDSFARLREELWVARTTLAWLRRETGGTVGTSTPRVLELTSELATALGTLAQNSDSLVVVKALQSVAASGDDASRALKSGVLDAAEVVLSRLDMDRRARQAVRFLEHE